MDFASEQIRDFSKSTWIWGMSGQGNYRPAMRLAREFRVDRPFVRATLYSSALGLYVPYVNGGEITDRRLMPGWTQYDVWVQYQAFDVTAHVKEGDNVLAALLGDGWFCGVISYVGMPEGECGFGRHPYFRAELEIEYADGSVEVVGTDKSWSSFYLDPALLDNDIYLGEEYDAMFDDTAWKLPGFKALPTLNGVNEAEWGGRLLPEIGEGVRVVREIRPVKIIRRPSGSYLLDFGENIAGVEKISLKGAYPGAVITVRHGEDLDADGNLWRGNLAFAKAKTTLTCGRSPGLTYVPRFTYYGFRYAEVSGWPEEMGEDSVTVQVLSAAVRRTGWFHCSSELLNKFFDNVIRSQQANFMDVPTDCPQRCERFGWTGDAQIFAETAMTNFDVSAFFAKWDRDLVAARSAQGAFAAIAPQQHAAGAPGKGSGSAGWSDAGVVCPWMHFRKYGDAAALREAYPAIARYAELLDADEKPGTIGDHLNLGEPTSNDFLAQALRVEMLRLAGLAALALGETADAERFGAWRKKHMAEFQARFFLPDGELTESTQTASAFAIAYGLCPSRTARAKAVAALAANIERRGRHLATGFLGTPVLLRALTDAGRLDLAYALLEQTTYPGWLYPVTQGATTIWERWNAKVDGQYYANWMNSLNHYAYGSVAAWLYDTVAGIRDLTEENPEWRAFRRFRLQPRPGGTLTSAEAKIETANGAIASSWRKEGEKLVWRFAVPEGTVAEILPPFVVGVWPDGIRLENGIRLAAPGEYELRG